LIYFALESRKFMYVLSAQSAEERAEVEAVLRSGIFDRAPNLASFLKYVCERHFEGESDSVKEYSIAVEALNRAEHFDPKKDSIVRVEAHRLRKRLAEYYDGPGAAHSIHIEIPNGQYAPRFVHQTPQSSEEPVPDRQLIEMPVMVTPAPAETAPAVAKGSPLSKVRVRILAAVLIPLVAALFLAFAIAGRHRTTTSSRAIEIWRGSTAEPVPGEYRFLAGYHGSPYTDRQGRIWQPDAYFEGGTSIPLPDDTRMAGLPDSKFAKSRREGSFRYAIPARQGTYELHLHFIGPRNGDPADPSSLSSFHVAVNDHIVLESFDPISEAGGPERLHSRVIRDVSPAADGKIHLAFQQLSTKAFVNAVEILSSEPGRVRPVRIVAAKSSVVDPDGSVWLADEGAIGGVLVERRDSIQDARLKMLFAGEHYGNFAYHVPMPPGRYRVKLYFAETYFGSKLPYAAGAAGARVFNVFANGEALLRDFDVAKDAGGPNRATIKTFENIEPNAQGNIVLEFVPVRNYAEVNAIEVSQMNSEAMPGQRLAEKK
jgi:hypothetical protein